MTEGERKARGDRAAKAYWAGEWCGDVRVCGYGTCESATVPPQGLCAEHIAWAEREIAQDHMDGGKARG